MDIPEIRRELFDHEKRISKLEEYVVIMTSSLSKIEGSQSTVEMILKWVVLPLLIILGTLVGIKIILP